MDRSELLALVDATLMGSLYIVRLLSVTWWICLNAVVCANSDGVQTPMPLSKRYQTRVWVGSLARITVQSAVLFALLQLLHISSPFAREALVCCSFPLATVAVLFAARYKAVESEAASMLLVSTLALAITVPTILWLSK